MKKLIVGTLGVVLVVASAYMAQADLSWGYGADLATWDASVQAGWFVQMYQDVNADTTVGSISAFDSSGTPTGGNSTDDVLLASFTDVTTSGKAGVIWGEVYASWSELYNDSVYSVLYNAATIGGAGQAVVIDASPTVMPGSDPYTYSQTSVNNSWVAVPEPTTLAFLGLGAVAFLLRKKVRA